MVRVFNVATTSNGTIIYSIGASLLSLFIAGTIIFSSLVMDNLKDDMGPRPDLPGTEDFVFQYIDAHFDGVGSMSTMINPLPSQFPLEKHCVSFSLTTNSAAWTTNNDNQNTINDNDAIALLTSADPPINNNATVSPDNEVLLSMVFPQHSLMVTHFQEYATRKSFLPAEHTKQSFTTEELSQFFSGKSNHLLGLNTIQTRTQARRGYFLLLSQISWRIKGGECCFLVPYFWNASHRNFMIRSKGSNLSHNHRLCSQLTVVDG
jgi:hypothetical protein